MAYIEVNALSVCLSGTFEACIFAPEPKALQEGNSFPVVWYIHEDGDSPYGLLRHTDILEKLAVEERLFVIAPAAGHSLCTDMAWGTKNETFLSGECVEIFRFLYPLSRDPQKNTVVGIGTGAYGACKLALNHPEVFGRGVAIEGRLDPVKGEFPCQSRASLEAVFGDPEAVAGSRNDLFWSAGESGGNLTLLCGRNSDAYPENERLARMSPRIVLRTAEERDDERSFVERQLEALAERLRQK